MSGQGGKRLVVLYDSNSFSPLQIADAAADCDLIWVVDTARESLGAMGQMLARFGSVVDIAGRPSEAVAADVAGHDPDGIVAFADTQLERASELAEHLGLPYNSQRAVRLVLDKYEQRSALASAGIETPRFVRLPSHSSKREIDELLEPISFPAVLKPVAGSSSRDVHHLADRGELDRLLVSVDALRNGEDHLVEEWLPDCTPRHEQVFGDYVSVEGVVVGGSVRPLAVTGKFPLAEPYRETGNFLPSQLPAATEASVGDLAVRAVRALGIEHGALHVEIKLTPSGPRVIEVNARVAGGGIADIFKMRTGVSLIRLAVQAALGRAADEEPAEHEGAVCYALFVQAPTAARRLTELGGLDAVASMPGVVQLFVNRYPGDELDWRKGSQGYLLSVRGVASDHHDLQQTARAILERLELGFEDDEALPQSSRKALNT